MVYTSPESELENSCQQLYIDRVQKTERERERKKEATKEKKKIEPIRRLSMKDVDEVQTGTVDLSQFAIGPTNPFFFLFLHRRNDTNFFLLFFFFVK